MPFNPQGYRFQVAFPNAFDVADTGRRADRWGVGGHRSSQSSSSRATTARWSRSRWTTSTRRSGATPGRSCATKTLLGETYVELTPGSPRSPPLPDGGQLPNGQVMPAVQLDRSSTRSIPRPRDAFREWQQETRQAIGDCRTPADLQRPEPQQRARQPADVRDQPDAAAAGAGHRAQRRWSRWCRNGGTTFAALNRDPAALRTLITAGDTTFGDAGAQQHRAVGGVPHLPDVPHPAAADDGRRCRPSRRTPTRWSGT